VSSLLLLNQESVQKLFVGKMLSLLTAMATGVPIAMTVIAQPTQSDAETKSDDQTNEINSQFQNPSSSSQTNCGDPEDISRTNRSMILNVLPPRNYNDI
jgi:hypothetical protein